MTCYRDHEVRKLFPSPHQAHSTTQSEVGQHGGNPCEPTDALPGSAAKAVVIAERARLNQALRHPRDARHYDGATPATDVSMPAIDPSGHGPQRCAPVLRAALRRQIEKRHDIMRARKRVCRVLAWRSDFGTE